MKEDSWVRSASSTRSKSLTWHVPTGPCLVHGKSAVVVPGGKGITDATGSGKVRGVGDVEQGGDGTTGEEDGREAAEEDGTSSWGELMVVEGRLAVRCFSCLPGICVWDSYRKKSMKARCYPPVIFSGPTGVCSRCGCGTFDIKRHGTFAIFSAQQNSAGSLVAVCEMLVTVGEVLYRLVTVSSARKILI